MASCNTCGETMSGGESGTLCSLCIAKMVNYAHGDYDDDNDPAVRRFRREVEGSNTGPSRGGGCAVVALALAAVPVVLAAAGIGVANLIG